MFIVWLLTTLLASLIIGFLVYHLERVVLERDFIRARHRALRSFLNTAEQQVEGLQSEVSAAEARSGGSDVHS